MVQSGGTYKEEKQEPQTKALANWTFWSKVSSISKTEMLAKTKKRSNFGWGPHFSDRKQLGFIICRMKKQNSMRTLCMVKQRNL